MEGTLSTQGVKQMTRKTLFTILVGEGWGYWDVTNYPRGGCLILEI